MNYSLAHSRQYRAPYSLDNISDYINRNWFRALTIGLGVYILFFKDISIQFNLNSAPSGLAEQVIISPEGAEVYQPAALPASYQDNAPRNVSHLAPPVKEKKGQKGWDSRKANDFSNLTFVLSPDYARRHNIHPDIVREKVDNCRRYVEEYAPIALKEMEDYGIPASITLAQGLLESNAGHSRLSRESNNHFGIKCRRKCRGCTCRNYTDDDIYDMFRVFDSPGESYREHSTLLTSARYKHLLQLRKTDYKKWAHGLKKAGYATDKRYAEKLIKIIEFLNLGRYDRMN
ncbi:MAG: glucosaminidase domain-containing protein [Phaeodactylibacter sp.]|nr:glucosaminidase domain-containing protein [Phaeodactylibacter sp.]MCB9050571.1 glucosaminidase domain-containing protein [Lewinellaceae bacterium]